VGLTLWKIAGKISFLFEKFSSSFFMKIKLKRNLLLVFSLL
jgi:hypothetical protein